MSITEPSQPRWGHTAIVVGASMSGLAAASVLSRHFDRVVVLERDSLPLGFEPRPSVPQGRHAHTLLGGGLRALESLYPGVQATLERAGAHRLQMDLDQRVERVGYDPYPSIDCGFSSLGLTRPLLEGCVREHARAQRGVEIEDGVAVQQLMIADGAVAGVRYKRGRGSPSDLAADLVVDCSGRSELTLRALRELGLPEPEETVSRIDVTYGSVMFEAPAGVHPRFTVTFPEVPRSSAVGLVAPVENSRFLVSLGGRGDESAPGDIDGWLAYARALRTETIGRLIADAKPLTDPVRVGFPASRRRHFETLPAWPARLVPVGDVICRFNPIYGQAMTVAALQAVALGACLARCAADSEPWTALHRAYLPEAAAILTHAWSMSVIPDFEYPQTIGTRPPDIARRLAGTRLMMRMASEDETIHRAMMRASHMLDPIGALQRPEIVERMQQLTERWAREKAQA